MKRSEFIKSSVLTGLAIGSGTRASADSSREYLAQGKPFNLNYALHDGMFANHGGKNFLDQIRYMHDQGFRAIEENGYLNRSVTEQEQIGNLLGKLDMTMGVFVVDGGDNWKPSLTTGKKEFRDRFIATCKKSVEAAKRCNAK